MLNQEFNNWQQDYTAKIRRWVPAYDQLIASMTTLAEDFKPADILDLGSGNGNAVAALLEKYPIADYTIVDASEEMIRASQERFAEQKAISYKEKFFQDLNFLPNSFDLVTAGLAFHHLDQVEKQSLFTQIYRWLRPGGCLSISDLFASKANPNYALNILTPWEEYAKKRGTSDEEWLNLMEHHAEFDFPDTLKDHLDWLASAGFKNASTKLVHGDWGNLKAFK